MPGGFSNKPKILHGAFVEFGLTIPPLIVVFQFNPVQLSRSRSANYNAPDSVRQRLYQTGGLYWNIDREFHKQKKYKDLFNIQKDQQVSLQEESINFEIRLDATDKLDEGDPITQQFGIAPQLATLELMLYPKNELILGIDLNSLFGQEDTGANYLRGGKMPMILFIWGRKRVLPVNIDNMNITETEFSTDLNPIRATISVSLKVIEGSNLPYSYSQVMKEVMSVLNIANMADIADIVIPG